MRDRWRGEGGGRGGGREGGGIEEKEGEWKGGME